MHVYFFSVLFPHSFGLASDEFRVNRGDLRGQEVCAWLPQQRSGGGSRSFPPIPLSRIHILRRHRQERFRDLIAAIDGSAYKKSPPKLSQAALPLLRLQ